MSESPRFIALVPAAGSGSRMGSDRPKQYLPLLDRPLLWHTLAALHREPRLSMVVVVTAPDDPWFDRFDWDGLPRLRRSRNGGQTRAESVRNGLLSLAEELSDDDWVLVHDAARPCLAPDDLGNLIDTLQNDEVGGLLAQRVSDTVKEADEYGRIRATRSRERLWLAQTPQMFRYRLLVDAHTGPLDNVTDEASAVERLGMAPKLVAGSRDNIKVTYPEDLPLATFLLGENAG